MSDTQFLVEYRCRSCHSICINDHRASCTRHRECRECHSFPELDPKPIDDRLPGLIWAFHFVLARDQAGLSARTASESEKSGLA